ncbi:IS605 family transposase OrfB, partial [mine drainage metagenome]
MRYRYRLAPAPGQRQQLARTFGCARVVFNDALRCREDARAAGERLRDSAIQSRVAAQAKRTPERAWLAAVSATALVQACGDARLAYRNWFASRSGQRQGRRLGPPRFRSRKDRRQTFRLTRQSFALRPNGRLSLAKIGEVRVRWSRPLPSPPSSVTVIGEADGRYYASFVVERAEAPFAPVQAEVGIDLGLERFLTTSQGTIVANPRPLRTRARKLAAAQRALSR